MSSFEEQDQDILASQKGTTWADFSALLHWGDSFVLKAMKDPCVLI